VEASKKQIQMRYDSAARGRVTRREVDPYRLWYASGGLYLIGYCHLRKEPRIFAVEAFVEDSLTVMRGPRIEVELIFEKRTASWAKDRVWHPSQQLTRVPGGKLRVTMTISDSRELVGWILSFGSGVRVVRPNGLRVAVVEEAGSTLRRNSGSTL
jgi:predicted DNA-binding transcriptional regulator YafY